MVIIGLILLSAGLCVLAEADRSTATWYYHEGSEKIADIPTIGGFIEEGLETFTESPADGRITAKIGYRILEIHHRIGILDIEEAQSWNEAEDTATNAGILTMGIGVLFLFCGGFTIGSGKK
ncbi:MAG: hypothetical protein ACOCZP_00990 [Candidatus Hadarchaeota archaeon]